MHEVKILSDEEFVEFRKKQRRESFLHELEQMSKPARQTKSSSFSIKDVSPKKEPPKPKEESEEYASLQPLNVSEDWSDFVADLGIYSDENLSPVDAVTDERITGFQLDDEIGEGENKYSNIFKKELAMLSEVLKDVKSHGTTIRNQLNKMANPAKGSGSRSVGITKNYSDLVEAYNSINTTKLQVIKEMAALRAKQVDWQMKDRKESGPEGANVDTIADNFYKSIINGGTKNFVQNGLQRFNQAEFEYDPLFDDQSSDVLGEEMADPSELDSLERGVGFNITQPLQGNRNGYDSGVVGDEFGYIAREKNPVDICVYEVGNGYQFVALDKDGEVVDGVELPSDVNPEILASLHIRPGSDYVYDKYNRKYRVIQMGPIDISDVDEMEYPYDDDDK